jgi:hypothetical protein
MKKPKRNLKKNLAKRNPIGRFQTDRRMLEGEPG